MSIYLYHPYLVNLIYTLYIILVHKNYYITPLNISMGEIQM